jgi:hypothetical protein
MLASIMAGLTIAPLALAHGPHSADSTLSHYLTSPDHVLNMLGVAALAVLTVAWAAGPTVPPVQRKKP